MLLGYQLRCPVLPGYQSVEVLGAARLSVEVPGAARLSVEVPSDACVC